MQDNHNDAFPLRQQRPFLAFVERDFPFPLALTYVRLHEAMDRDEPIEAAWRLRDAFECSVKFAAVLALADQLQADPNSDASTKSLGLLLKPNGLSIGDWHALIELALKPLTSHAQAQRLADSGRALAGLYDLFFQAKPKGSIRTSLNLDIDGRGADSFVAWRNRVFGHGIFQENKGWYAQETLRWLPRLHSFYEALQPLLNDWQLETEAGEVTLQGLPATGPTIAHEHEAMGTATAIRFRSLSDSARTLSLGPLLSIQRCSICQDTAVFFFDRHYSGRGKTRLLEYFRGHVSQIKSWEPLQALADRLPPNFTWQRESYDGEELDEQQGIVFRDFETEYLRPDYLLEAIWAFIDEQPRGYVHLVGPGGTGKSYLARGLEAEGETRDAPVLGYYVRAGDSTSHQTFVSELKQRAYEQFRHKTPEVQASGTTPDALQRDLVSFLETLKQANGLGNLVLMLDGLDELPEPAEKSPSIVDYLPAPAMLPEGCYVVLTSRPEVSQQTRVRLDALQADTTYFRAQSLSAEGEANRVLLHNYLTRNLPDAYRTPAQIKQILNRSQGVFLYAYHMAQALSSGVFATVEGLPDAGEFYPAYLTQLRARVGNQLYENVYEKALLCLCAAQTPVTLEQLESWGLPSDRLHVALLDLRDFIREHRSTPWHERLGEDTGEKRYEIAHAAFQRFVADDATLSQSLISTHHEIASALRGEYGESWETIEPEQTADLYALMYWPVHLQFALRRSDVLVEVLHTSKAYNEIWGRVVVIAANTQHYHLALDLLTALVSGYRRRAATGRKDREIFLAKGLKEQGRVLVNMGRATEALEVLSEAAEIFGQLIAAGQEELESDLAQVYMQHGNALYSLGCAREAIDVHALSLDMYQRLVAAGRTEFDIELAHVLSNQGNALSALGCLGEAQKSFSRAEDIYRRLVATGLASAEVELANSLSSQTSVHLQMGHASEALEKSTAAVNIVRRLLASGRGELETSLASALVNQCMALFELGQENRTLELYAESTEIYRRLIAAGRDELDTGLAMAFMGWAITLNELGSEAEAEEALERSAVALEIFQRSVAAGRTEFEKDLATTLYLQANALRSIGRVDVAIERYAEAEDVFRRLVAAGRTELERDLAVVLTNQGRAFDILEREDEALKSFTESVDVSRGLNAAGQSHSDLEQLAESMRDLGMLQSKLCRFSDALASLTDSADIYRKLIAAGDAKLARSLATTIHFQADAFGKLNRLEEKIFAMEEVVSIYRGLAGYGNIKSESEFAQVLSFYGRALEGIGREREALKAYSESMTMLQELVGAGQTELEGSLTAVHKSALRMKSNTKKRRKNSMTDETERKAIMGIAQIPILLSGIIVIVFCLWIVFSTPDVSYTWWQSIGYVLLCWIVPGLVRSIPFIGPFLLQPSIPVGLELWWRDIDLSGVSVLAWVICAVVLVINILGVIWFAMLVSELD